ncbi:39S ribosomal protein L47, mitochondrial-like [Lytechinus variegatus]|uniref:39S ribosomal protein L47, mitochondrial-like n=1 Tax=Lytechinus variegatus TaxID=7654 RepID=UPI001BB20BF4|nr:39S ribosomal protein L47, mitochondrial-like [Lytechinus variegatus]
MASLTCRFRIGTHLSRVVTNLSNTFRCIDLGLFSWKFRRLDQEARYSPCYPFQRILLSGKNHPQHSFLAARPFLAASFHSTTAIRGLEEFFDDPKNWGQPVVKAGRAWSKDELRLKDYVTLHKLWYVLLKEKNMLLTMQTEADRQEKFLPSPERINKVEVSMENLKVILKERQEALTELKTGHKEEHPGEWQYTPFGYKRFVKPKEYKVPKYMNKMWSTKRKWYDPFFGRYLSRFYEQEIKRGGRERRKRRSHILKLKQRFPDSEIWENK